MIEAQELQTLSKNKEAKCNPDLYAALEEASLHSLSLPEHLRYRYPGVMIRINTRSEIMDKYAQLMFPDHHSHFA
jgi:hypothetical protein